MGRATRGRSQSSHHNSPPTHTLLACRYEPKYGEGAFCSNCHVIIPRSHASLLPAKRADEEARLAEYPFPEDMTDTSRLACQVDVTADMHGMVVYVPDGPPSDLP